MYQKLAVWRATSRVFVQAKAGRRALADFKRLSDESQVFRKQREDKMAKGQLRSGREKKKPKAEKNRKKKSAPSRLAILARADNWERRFRQEIPVAHKAAATDHGMR